MAVHVVLKKDNLIFKNCVSILSSVLVALEGWEEKIWL